MMDFEQIVTSAKDAGWDWFEQLDDKAQSALALKQEKDLQDQAAINSAWAAFARTPGGRKALEQLFQSTLLRTVYFVSLGIDPASMATYGAFREGQNSVAHLIARAIADGRGEDLKPRDV